MVRVCFTQSDGVGDLELGESKDDVFSAIAQDIEEMFLHNLFNVGVEGLSVVYCTSFVCSLVHILDCNRGGEFFSKESAFLDKLPVNVMLGPG